MEQMFLFADNSKDHLKLLQYVYVFWNDILMGRKECRNYALAIHVVSR